MKAENKIETNPHFTNISRSPTEDVFTGPRRGNYLKFIKLDSDNSFSINKNQKVSKIITKGTSDVLFSPVDNSKIVFSTLQSNNIYFYDYLRPSYKDDCLFLSRQTFWRPQTNDHSPFLEQGESFPSV